MKILCDIEGTINTPRDIRWLWELVEVGHTIVLYSHEVNTRLFGMMLGLDFRLKSQGIPQGFDIIIDNLPQYHNHAGKYFSQVGRAMDFIMPLDRGMYV